jgi:hypothetical protein
MTFLYSCRHDGDQFRITKFDEHLNVESSYLCTAHECTCPAGVRPRCRHREMLPLFIHREAVDSGWWLDYDRGGWVQMQDDPEPEPIETMITLPDDANVAEEFAKLLYPPLPDGVQMFTLDDPLQIHNAIAEAIGEPEAIIRTPLPKPSWRRF